MLGAKNAHRNLVETGVPRLYKIYNEFMFL